MEKEENDAFTKEQKDEKMKQRLQANGLYDQGYNNKTMRKIIDMLNESEEMANRNQNKEVIRMEQKSFDESDNHIEDKGNSLKEETHCQKLKKRKNKNLKSNVLHTTKTTNKISPLTDSENSMQESNTLSIGNKMDTIEHKGKFNRWKMNPLNYQCNKRDVPLLQPDRLTTEEPVPFGLCKEADTVEEHNKVMNVLNDHLKAVSYLWYKWYSVGQTKFQWVQVDLTENKKPTTDCLNATVETKDKDKHEQISKRKSISIWTQLFDSSSDENDENATNPEKRKKIEDVSDLLHSKEEESTENVLTHEQQNRMNSLLHDDRDGESTDDTNAKGITTELHKQFETRKECPKKFFHSKMTTSENLKENVPKNKKRFCLSSIKHRRNLHNDNGEGTSAASSIYENKSHGLIDEEILLNLDKTNNEDAALKKDVVIKPLPLSARIAKQCEMLRQMDVENKKKLLAEQDKNRKKEIAEKEWRRQEFNKRRKQELEEESKRQEKMQKKEQEKDKWLDLLQSRNKMRIAERKDEEKKQLEKRNNEDSFEVTDNVYGFKETENEIYYLKDKVTCPICKKAFATDKIETHAALCEQFEVEYEEQEEEEKEDYVGYNKKSTAAYECNICLSFKTNNGIDYEDHVNTCIQHKQNASSQGSIISITNTPHSPVHSFKSVSEQNDTDVDYIGQWHASGNVSRKRKH